MPKIMNQTENHHKFVTYVWNDKVAMDGIFLGHYFHFSVVKKLKVLFDDRVFHAICLMGFGM